MSKKMQIPMIATGTGNDLRHAIRRLTAAGAIVAIDRPNHKVINNADGFPVLTALKYRAGWDIRICATMKHHIHA